MTTIATPGPVTTSRSTVAVAGAGSTVLALGFTALGAHDWTEIAVIGGVVLVAALLVYGWVVPHALRKESSGGTALALSVPAVLLVVPAFWSGLPMVLGIAGILVGNAGRHARKGAGLCIAGLIIGALAVAAYVSFYVSDAMNGGAGFLFD